MRLVGVSTIRKEPSARNMAGRAAPPRDNLQPHGWIWDVAKLTKLAPRMPIVISNWKQILRAPLCFAGAISDMNNGTACSLYYFDHWS